MRSIEGIGCDSLTRLGARLREARIARHDAQSVFAERIGASVRTVRAMENGDPKVAIGYWIAAFWVLDRLRELDALLPQGSLFDSYEGRKRIGQSRRGNS
jgi:transcriptional regulator with XRE-family HTH domain